MAVPEQTPYIEHTGNGVTTSFSLGFQCESKDHLIVLMDEIEPPIATWSLTDGNVVFTTAPAAGKKIKLQRNTPFGRTTNYQSFNNSFRPQTVNIDFDRIWWKLQELGVADWILGARIDALKNYVDRKDDELKAYLMEEIRKQGVALDQLDEYYNYLMQRLAQIAVDKGWDASFVVDGDKNQHQINQEQLTKNEEIRSDITKVESYIVYAEKYGSSLNEAMSAINTEFSGQRVRVYVPSDFPVTDTVNINIDCDLDLSTLQIQNDIDVVFNPADGWSGSATKCDIFCNNYGIRIGWNLKKDLGIVSIFDHAFISVGNALLNTSADYFIAFYLPTVGAKKIDLYNATVLNSYVKPNSVVGDVTGSNRAILIEGVYDGTKAVSDINIFNFKANDLLSNEDSDALVVNTSNSSIDGAEYNIDIYNGTALNVGKRLYKFMLFKKSSGIRLNGTHVATGAGMYAYAAMDLYGKGTIDADGLLISKNFLNAINSTESVLFNGEGFNVNAEVNHANIDGNNFRTISLSGATNASQMTLNSVTSRGGAEAIIVGALTAKLSIKTLDYKAWVRVLSNAGNLTIEKNNTTLENAPESAQGVVATTYLYQLGKIANIKNVRFESTASAQVQYLMQSLAGADITLDDVVAENGISAAILRAVTANNLKLRRLKAPGLNSYVVRMESNCNNVLLDQCTKTGDVLYYDVGNTSTNIVELNTLTF